MQDYYEPKPGDMAPPFSLPSAGGETVSLTDFKGKQLVVYFYPKDDTPGCTAEACSFRDSASELKEAGVAVVGISTDPIESHQKFRDKHKLNFPLLSDEMADVAKMYGVWRERNLEGRRSWGVARTTYLIGPDGRVDKVYKKIDTANHARDILGEIATRK